jgi:hypothetical protein
VNHLIGHAGRAARRFAAASVVTAVGVPGLIIASALILVLVGVACWVISDKGRSDRVTRMIYARRGDARCLEEDLPRSQRRYILRQRQDPRVSSRQP